MMILKEAEREGVELTIRKHGVYPSTFYSWRKKYLIEGAEVFVQRERSVRDDAYIKRLEDENTLYKQLLAERELELALKDELLKKKYPHALRK